MIAATFYIGIIVLIILYYIIISNTYDTKGFIIGTSQYTPERKIKIGKTYLSDPSTRKTERNWDRNIILVKPIDDNKEGKWKKDDILIFRKYIGQSIKKKYIILQNRRKEKRIAYCTAESSGFPPIFDGSETLIEYEIIGVLESSYTPQKSYN